MYTIHLDGQLLFSNRIDDEVHAVLSPKLTLDVKSSGSLSFVLPPSNHMHGNIRKMKSIITVEQNGDEIFRGRAVEVETDIWNQKSVYCEGALSFLLDSLQQPMSFKGKAADVFRTVIANHNEQVDEEKRFAVGNIAAVFEDEELPEQDTNYTTVYWKTSDMINDNFIDVLGGYLLARVSDGTLYIDWLSELGDGESSEIRFSVNMLDLTDKSDAGDMFTVLIPFGWSEIGSDGAYSEPVNITSVNDGKNYIQDDEAVARYGKIWRTYTWANTKDPAELLEKARKHLATGAALRTLSIKAVDMHFLNGNVGMVRIGQIVHIASDSHGIDIEKACVKMDIDLVDPENTAYTFGEKPRTFTESAVRTENKVYQMTGGGRGGGGRRSVQQEISDIIRWAEINKDETNAYIQLTAGELDKTNQKLSAAEIDIDGLEAEIVLKASQELVEDTRKRLSFAGIDINGEASSIKLLARQEVVDDLEESVSEAWISIDGKASRVEINALETYIDNLIAGSVKATLLRTANITADGANIGSMSYNGSYITKRSATFLTNSSSITVQSDGVGVTNVVFNKQTDSIDYLAW